MNSNFLKNALVLGLLSAIGPFAIDMYLPALPSIGHTLGASPGAVQASPAVPGGPGAPVAASPAASPSADAATPESDPAAKKKRGFFGRLFLGNPKESPEKPKPPKPNQ